MKFTLGWLKEHLDTDASLEEIADRLTMLGLEVEGIENPAEKLGAFSVARIIEAGPHPDADKLKLCKVEARVGGEKQMLQIVCGAPNARSGLMGILAPSGATIPANGMVLKPTKIRGVESNGMLCSERELELSDAHEGIIELEGNFEVGTPAAEALGLNDPVIDIAITPNRPDCLGVRGIARDLAAAGLGRLKSGAIEPIEGTFESPVRIRLEFGEDAKDACPLFVGRLVRGITNGPSPAWLQARLKAIGLRPINALVDITNYIAYDRGRPLHVYDAAKLTGDIRARLGRGETFQALDGKDYVAEETMTVIADDKAVLGLGGIMGGEMSGSTATTTDVFVESAYFDPVRTAATGRKTGINSDARYRFERGVDPEFVMPGCDLAVGMIRDLCGGEASELIVAGAVPSYEKIIDFDPARVRRLTGLDVPRAGIEKILTALGFILGPGAQDHLIGVTVPSWRPDIEGAADLVEEVVRIYGLDHVASTPLKRTMAVAKPILSTAQRRVRTAKRTLAARGLIEAVTWSFISHRQAELFGEGADLDRLELANPISSEMSHMRPSLLAGLIAAVGRNADRGFSDVALFEVGQQYRGDRPQDQIIAASGVRRGTAHVEGAGRHWQGTAGPVGVFDAKADAMAVLASLGAPVETLQVTAEAPGWYHPGRSGTLRLGPKNILATFGELHPRLLSSMDVAGPLVGFEVFIEAIPEPKKKPTKAKPPLDISDLQPVRRDFAFIVMKDLPAETLVRAARGADRKLIVDVALFDMFEGGNMADDQKSLAIEVTLQPAEKTLTDEDIDAVSNKIIAAVIKATGGVLRG